MPTCKAEAHRALEVLEQYFSTLDDLEEKALKAAIERVIRIFKSRLFEALLDMQELYEMTLMDESKSDDEKARQALLIAARWEINNRPFPITQQQLQPAQSPVQTLKNNSMPYKDSSSQTKTPLNVMSAQMRQELLGKFSDFGLDETQQANSSTVHSGAISRPTTEERNLPMYHYEEVVLERGAAGLGFSIAGGIDNPQVENDTSIYITQLTPGGAAAKDKRLHIDDKILKVNDVSVVNVPHAVAVEALRRAGNHVVLQVKRRMTNVKEELLQVELGRGSKGLGFTIAGGIGSQHIPGDNGIYVSKVMEGGAAARSGQISVGDRLVAVKNCPPGSGQDFVLDDCTQDEAVAALKKCKNKVILVIKKGDTSYPSSPTVGQMQQLGMNYQMPQHAASDEDLGMPRHVVLTKGRAGFGFNIIGAEGGEGIFISYILAGGPADCGGQMRRGDKILCVSGIDLSQATHEEAAVALKNAGNSITLTLLYCPNEYDKFEAKIHTIKNQVMSSRMLKMSDKKNQFVRALFDYDPSQDDGLPSQGLHFIFGDILRVMNASDDDWWQARLLDAYGSEVSSGIIPSRSRWERKMTAKDRNVKWKRKGSSRKLAGFFRARNSDVTDSSNHTVASNEVDQKQQHILSYELVQQIEIEYMRPVIILGLHKDRINDELISEFPEKFGSCIPHTTRPKRQFEIDGRDYHFVHSHEAMEQDIKNHKFIEAGQYHDNLYGTSLASVKLVAERGKHCLLDVSGNAIKRLQIAQLFPIAIFVRPGGLAFIKQCNRGKTQEECEKILSRAQKLEADFLQYFTAVIDADEFKNVYANIKKLITVHSGPKIWVPASEAF